MISGGSLSLFNQVVIAYNGHVITYGLPYHDNSPILNEDLLRMATMGGAEALSWDESIGSLEVGKKADLIILSRNELDTLPSYDSLHTVASNGTTAKINTVIVNGKVVVKDGTLTTIDEEELKERVKERAPKIVSRFLERLG